MQELGMTNKDQEIYLKKKAREGEKRQGVEPPLND